jgi:ribonucleoside-diphosphate reductase alpha chain
MQTETGDIRAKCFDIFPSVSIPDLFMERLEQDGEWTLFDPKEVEDKTGERLQDKFGMDFNVFYQSLERNESLELINKVKAKDLFKKLLKSVVETGMPYVFFRDTVNNLNPNKHCGNIYSSNLCTEIAQNMKPNKFISEKTSD